MGMEVSLVSGVDKLVGVVGGVEAACGMLVRTATRLRTSSCSSPIFDAVSMTPCTRSSRRR
jgi:hypothetical protein